MTYIVITDEHFKEKLINILIENQDNAFENTADIIIKEMFGVAIC